ncbi:hypothetical protein A2627_03555 [Candidatus Woesebacteria bacterium RIFCSPHIGHO2_01_FULL_39_28]|uniref:Uncharacterized protein n=1 Tax=Candidatus Woesebacteria bacterium RIFCSPHIGHO2_01_FULL_39_28 TaxID=1802496 RepID=A0A1F7Y9Y6_9BACT|nr:MAG: hypothetical protein A2627_03555 [Candidatus Woesebacteria bacterium RIFCSPHIGHO2_01_FULL_39_28]OGM57423.1 MAG: hypothetical protein A3A50_05830 [Candidatus Woesebacteria bacterium RIFCSPLOWO2_01_FULL_38_20]
MKTDRKQAEILGVKIDSASKGRVLSAISNKLSAKKKFFVVTPNPEIIMLAQKDQDLQKILNSADISIPDGVGLVLAAKFLRESRLERIRGRELMLDLLTNTKKPNPLAGRVGAKFFLLGSTPGINKKAVEVLSREFKNIKFKGNFGYQLNSSAVPVSKIDIGLEKKVVRQINLFKPHFLFVAFGAPKQEKWIAKWLPKLDVGGAMAVGGAFDYIAGVAKLPPGWMESIGFEWLWRLFTQTNRPGNFRRIFTATVKFSLEVIKHKR